MRLSFSMLAGKYVLNISLIVVMALCTLVFDSGSENVFCVPVACFMGIVSFGSL